MVKGILVLSLILGILLSVSFANIASAAGREVITLTKNSSSVPPGGNVIANYSLKLTNGTFSFSTTFYIVNNKLLISNGISVLLTTKAGNPGTVGTLYAFSSSTTPPLIY